MLEDRRLVEVQPGDTRALRRIYEKYRSDLFRVAGALLHDPAAVEDVVHDVFVAFACQAGRFELQRLAQGVPGDLRGQPGPELRPAGTTDLFYDFGRSGPRRTQRRSRRIGTHEKVRAALAGLDPVNARRSSCTCWVLCGFVRSPVRPANRSIRSRVTIATGSPS